MLMVIVKTTVVAMQVDREDYPNECDTNQKIEELEKNSLYAEPYLFENFDPESESFTVSVIGD